MWNSRGPASVVIAVCKDSSRSNAMRSAVWNGCGPRGRGDQGLAAVWSVRSLLQTARTFCASGPLAPWATSNSTCWPSSRLLCPCRDVGEVDEHVLLPVDGVMKPKPRSLLKNFTVPVSMCSFSFSCHCCCFLVLMAVSIELRLSASAPYGAPHGGGLAGLAVVATLLVVAPSEAEVAVKHLPGVRIAQRDVGQDHGDGERVVVRIGTPIECPAGRCHQRGRAPSAQGAR